MAKCDENNEDKKVISPLLFGLGLKMNYTIGPKTSIIEFAKLGFPISHNKVK